MPLLAALCLAASVPKVVVGYAPNWNDAAALAASIDYSRITHLDVAFENPTTDEGELSFNPDDKALIDAAHAHHVKVMVSIGGGGVSENPTMRTRFFGLQADTRRAGFVSKLAAYVDSHGFDGLDVDLEGDAIGKDYGPFVMDLAAALKAKGKLISAAVSEGNGGANIPDDALGKFDLVNVMAYDNTGPWSPDRPGQHSSIADAKATVKYWLDRGVAKEKLLLGVPFYGYGFGDSKGEYSYKDLVAKYPGSEMLDMVATTIWYNGIPTIKAKAKWAHDQGLGGIMIWSLDGDVAGDKSLLKAIDDGWSG